MSRYLDDLILGIGLILVGVALYMALGPIAAVAWAGGCFMAIGIAMGARNARKARADRR